MKKLLIGLLALVLVGCAGGTKAPRQQDYVAKMFNVPSDGTSNLYIYRNEILGGDVGMDIYIDEKRIARTGPQTYILVNLPAGKHRIEGFAGRKPSVLTVNLLPNSLKFIWQEVKIDLLFAENKLQEVSDDIGKKGVLESQLLESSYQLPKNKATTTVKNANPKSNHRHSSTPKANKIQKSASVNQPIKTAKKRKIYYSSGCPCGYGYCYGPRGGRYCITSGGNKSYR
ncbi:uncharacterized protein DUF2846 [Vespertiliibacter pulmonis]|uniref:Uncharacterized protein DUF2846 n=1 Tax=Vespertiliibacter pulmonis TaxID=1443036 RepID=A0A3N4WJF3_9PAST|nr:DUF2846 domain-containing protein [Vespertiliibacter pulmonis]RPE86070.1 uncharacterized protein DUF2846 [Vespertiliibacter pulmonis]